MNLAEYDRLPSTRVPVDGGEMFVIDAGEGPAVVLVHGSPVSSLEYRALIGSLKDRFRVVAPDLLTYGRSTGPADGANFTQQVRALRSLLDALDLGRFHLVGHDWGGPIAMGAAAQRPEQVARIVLMNTSIRADFRPPLAWQPVIAPIVGETAIVHANLMSHGLPLLLRAMWTDGELRRRHHAPLEKECTRRTALRLERREGYEAVCEQIAGALPAMDGPSLILWGTPEPYFRGEHRHLEASLPGARLIELAGAGHFVPEDASAAACGHIGEFLG